METTVRRFLRALVLVCAVSAMSGGCGQSPTSPTHATLALTVQNVQGTVTATGFSYTFTIHAQNTGAASASVTSVTIALQSGTTTLMSATPDAVFAGAIAAAAGADSRSITIADEGAGHPPASSISVGITFADSSSTAGTSSATGAVPAILAVTSLSVSLSSSSVVVGDVVTAASSAMLGNGSTIVVVPVWQSSQTGVATVDAGGHVHGVAPGSSTISGTYGGQTASAVVQVQPTGPRTTFGGGQYRVGIDIQPGRYFTDPSPGCYWERESGLGGTPAEIIANGSITYDAGQWAVDIAATDVGFKTSGECNSWSPLEVRGFQATITPGLWVAGDQFLAQTYSASAKAGCSWQRLANFSGESSAVIAQNSVSSNTAQVVPLAASDAGFSANALCGNWTRVSSIASNFIRTIIAQPGSGFQVPGSRFSTR